MLLTLYYNGCILRLSEHEQNRTNRKGVTNMAEAKFDKETREFIENLFKEQKYSLEKQISYLEIKERQKYNYYCSRTNNTWNWSQADDDKFNAEWNEIIEMINERKGITA